jgi:RNA polymerase sigma-70 factor (ECF subfamily)
MKAMIIGRLNITAEAPMKEADGKVKPGDSRVADLGSVYDRYAAGLLRYARALLGSIDDAEDAVQEVFVRLARDLDRIRKVEDTRSYLLKATRNAAYGILRGKQRRQRLEESVIEDLINCPPEGCGPEVDEILKAFADLPVEQREVLALKVFQGLTFREIAGIIGKSQNTVSSRYRYAVERIREKVGEE